MSNRTDWTRGGNPATIEHAQTLRKDTPMTDINQIDAEQPARHRYLVTLTAEEGGAEFEYEVEGIFSPRVLAHFVWRKHHRDGGLPALIQPIAAMDLGPADN